MGDLAKPLQRERAFGEKYNYSYEAYNNHNVESFANNICVIVPSHITSIFRLSKLFQCLDSLVNQKYKCLVILDISFENHNISQVFDRQFDKNKESNQAYSECIQMYSLGTTKTSQFNHIYNAMGLINNGIKDGSLHINYIMFCDDDDLYDSSRVLRFSIAKDSLLNYIANYPDDDCVGGKLLGGIYDGGRTNSETVVEYYHYMLSVELINRFFERINHTLVQGWDYINHVYCDTLFTRFVKCTDSKYIFGCMYSDHYIHNQYDESVCANIQNTPMTDPDDEVEFMSRMQDNVFLSMVMYFNHSYDACHKHMVKFKKIHANHIKQPYKSKLKVYTKRLLDDLTFICDNLEPSCSYNTIRIGSDSLCYKVLT